MTLNRYCLPTYHRIGAEFLPISVAGSCWREPTCWEGVGPERDHTAYRFGTKWQSRGGALTLVR